MPQRITPFLWFDSNAEEAANYYVSVFPNSEITEVSRYGEAGPGAAGRSWSSRSGSMGRGSSALNGGPEFTFTEAISFSSTCANQEEVDYYWDKLTDGRRAGAVRVAEGQVRRLLAGQPDRPDGDAAGRGPGTGRPGHAGDAANGQDRHRQARGGLRPEVATVATPSSSAASCATGSQSPFQGAACPDSAVGWVRAMNTCSGSVRLRRPAPCPAPGLVRRR